MVGPKGNQPLPTRQVFLVFLLFGGFGVAQPRVLDRSVAQVDGRVITYSELQFEARILLVQAGGTEAAFAPLPDETLRKVLDRLGRFKLKKG